MSVEIVSNLLAPGLLQSPLYARHVFCEGRLNDPMSVIDCLVKVRCARLESLTSDLRVFATFPEIGLICVPEAARREQALHLLRLIDSGRVRIHLVPRASILAGVISPFQIYQLRDGSRAATCDHTNGAIVINETSGVTRLQELARSALGSALPVDESIRTLKELST
ncbi:hypothetical protein BJF83_17930 [Nocardiopsis sp. CNR-923]|nr:hypothetical protein BJF83_17930 [Nocardiopsis sp. CNR-923]